MSTHDYLANPRNNHRQRMSHTYPPLKRFRKASPIHSLPWIFSFVLWRFLSVLFEGTSFNRFFKALEHAKALRDHMFFK